MALATDQERIEQIKTWWKKNSTAIILGLLIGVTGLVSWNIWSGHSERTGQRASELYDSLRAAVWMDQELALDQGSRLMSEFKNTPYAHLAALELARLAVQRGERAEAEQNLRFVISGSRHAEQQALARVRLARLMLEDGRAAQALELLNAPMPAAFSGIVEELRGDAHMLLGDTDAARLAYDRALAEQTTESDFLQMKRSALGDSPEVAGAP